MTNEQQQVKQFMQVFGQEAPSKPTIPSLEMRKLRAMLILEEALETIRALGIVAKGFCPDEHIEICIEDVQFEQIVSINPSLVEIADGLADLHYVAYCGTAVACGLDMEPIFAEVHRSNITKLWTTEEWNKTNSMYKREYVYQSIIKRDMTEGEANSKRWVVSNRDGKVIKSPSYNPASLEPIIQAQINGISNA